MPRIDMEAFAKQQALEWQRAEKVNHIIDIAANLGAPGNPSIYQGELYGKLGSLTYQMQGYPASNPLTWTGALEILQAFQPIAAPLAKLKMIPWAPVFVPLRWALECPDAYQKKNHWDEFHQVCNAKVEISEFSSEIYMLVELPEDLGFFTVCIQSYHSHAFGIFTSERRDCKGGYRYVNRGYQFVKGASSIAPIQKGQTNTGSESSPGNFYAWWELPEGPEPTAADLLRAIVTKTI